MIKELRLTKEQQEGLKRKYGVDRLWSYSRLSTYVEHPWEYKIVYLDKSARSDNVYSRFGTVVHDIIQEHYEGKHSYEDMIELFDKYVEEWRKDNNGFRFATKKIEDGYIENLRHYFKNTDIVKYKLVNEKPVLLTLYDDVLNKNVVFIGYLDSEYIDENGIFHIVDYKSSSKGDFVGKKLKEKSKQLKLYALAINQQRNIPLDKINLRFDMAKYLNVSYLQKNGKWRKSLQERSKWVASQEKKIRSLLTENDEDFIEIDLMVEQAKLDNDLGGMPDYVKEKFKIENCLIDVQIDEKEAKELKDWLVKKTRECVEKENGDWDVEFPEPSLEELDSFYYAQLASQIRSKSIVWQENLELKNRGNVPVSEVDEAFFDDLFN